MKTLIIILVLVLLVGGGAMGLGIWARQQMRTKSINWKKQKIETGELVVVASATGGVEPVNTVQVGSQVSGRVKQVFVEIDSRVKVGDVLAVLDKELLETERRDKEIMLQQAQANLKILQVEREALDLREKRLKLNLERETVAKARVQAVLEQETKNLGNYEEMFRVSAVTQIELDIRKLTKENAERDLELKKLDTRQLQLDLEDIGVGRTSLLAREKQAQLNVDQTQQILNRAITNEKYAEIISPIDGVVFERTVEPGQTIAAQFQAPNLFKIVSDLKRVNILAQIDESDVSKIRAGQSVSFEVDAFRGEKFTGKVKSVRLKNELRNNLITYPVVIEAENPQIEGFTNGRLRPGMTAYIDFEIERKKDVVRIPATALRYVPFDMSQVESSMKTIATDDPDNESQDKPHTRSQKGTAGTVYVMGSEGKLKTVSVRVGANDAECFELLSNELKAGDEVITGIDGPIPFTFRK